MMPQGQGYTEPMSWADMQEEDDKQAAGISGSLDELGSILQQMELEARGQVTSSAAARISLLLLSTAWLLHGKG